MAGLSRFLRPEASRRLLVGEGEFVVDEVTKHWVTYIGPVDLVIAGTCRCRVNTDPVAPSES